ncbi:hypothetical protein ACHAXT_006133 [Thalassiosira profunda]
MNRSTGVSLDFKDYVDTRDYVGALAALDVDDGVTPIDTLLWTGYCSDKLGHYERAEEAYLELLHGGERNDADVPLITNLYLAIVYLHMGRYTEAEETALTFEPSNEFETGLKSRILLQTALKTRDETKLAEYRQLVSSDAVEDKLSIAAVEYSARHRFQDAIDVFRDLLANDTDALALYVYTAMSLFQRGDYEQSLEALDVAAESHPNSPIVANLKACNFFRLQDGKAALDALEALCDSKTREAHDLVRHNIAVFNGGEQALQVWPKLVDRVPEARINLAILYLREGELEAARSLVGDMDADTPRSHMVLGVLNAELARINDDAKALSFAKHHFKCAGDSPTECDTVLGRQCTASYLCLNSSFADAVPYLESIESYLEEEEDSDALQWNLGIALASSGNFEQGLQALLQVSNESYKSELAYSLWLAKCYVMTDQPAEAWEVYLQIEDSGVSFEVLQLIANESYKMGGAQFLYSARSFAELLKVDGDYSYPDFVDGLVGSSAGYLRYVVAAEYKSKHLSQIDSDNLMEIVEVLEASQLPKGRQVARAIRSWLEERQ